MFEFFQQLHRRQRMYVGLMVAIMLTVIAYCAKVERASGGLCREVEAHIVTLLKPAGGALRTEDAVYAENIASQCQRHYSTSFAKCILKADSMQAVHACKP